MLFARGGWLQFLPNLQELALIIAVGGRGSRRAVYRKLLTA